ncbi:NADH:flavin oxidoreductase/NADH oxidase [Penicillium herquei]|nr:NADH:flavin oxidoreductase/NADH oxidase [Penicillium herquei]
MVPKRIPAQHVEPGALGQLLQFTFSGKNAPNRFLKSSMSEKLSSWKPEVLEERGVPSTGLINLYRRWGEGGWGILITGNVMLDYENLEGPGNAIIPSGSPFSGDRFQTFKTLAHEAKKHGSLIFAQLCHPGRQTPDNVQQHPISASDVQLEGRTLGSLFAKPRAMVKEDFDQVIEGFAHAAEYCYRAGFDGIELNAAHGYLLTQFLSPTTNLRTDQYGGSIENRSRIIMEITDAIRARVPKTFSLGIKVNSVELQDGGFTTEDAKIFCTQLEKAGFDWVELSGGTYQAPALSHVRESTKKREAYFLEFAEMIIPELKKTKVYVTGGLRTVNAMVNAVKSVHGVGLARPSIHELDFPRKVFEEKIRSVPELMLDEQDFPTSSIAAGIQMRLVGNDKQPLDLSQKKHMQVFHSTLQRFFGEMAQNADDFKYGFPDIIDFALNPYGTPYLE